jgi:hypothetical protein
VTFISPIPFVLPRLNVNHFGVGARGVYALLPAWWRPLRSSFRGRLGGRDGSRGEDVCAALFDWYRLQLGSLLRYVVRRIAFNNNFVQATAASDNIWRCASQYQRSSHRAPSVYPSPRVYMALATFSVRASHQLITGRHDSIPLRCGLVPRRRIFCRNLDRLFACAALMATQRYYRIRHHFSASVHGTRLAAASRVAAGSLRCWTVFARALVCMAWPGITWFAFLTRERTPAVFMSRQRLPRPPPFTQRTHLLYGYLTSVISALSGYRHSPSPSHPELLGGRPTGEQRAPSYRVVAMQCFNIPSRFSAAWDARGTV